MARRCGGAAAALRRRCGGAAAALSAVLSRRAVRFCVLADAIVERLDPSTVVVRWTWAGSPRGPVTIAATTSLADGTGGPVVVAEADAVEARIAVPVSPRHLFLVRAADGPELVVAERRLALDGTLNFRDLGGYRGLDGRAVRWGRVFRSDNLAAVDHSGWASVAALGVRAVYDLRHEVERERAPSRIPPDLGIAQHHLPIGGEAAEAPDLVEMLRHDAPRFGLDFMVDLNRSLLNEHAAVFGLLITELANEARLPAVFHCTAGKDRTGVAAALVLSVLGVARDDVLDDYELTTVYRSNVRIEQLRPGLAEAGVDIEQVRPFLSAPRPALEVALTELEATHGSVDRYLLETAGVDLAVLEALRANLLFLSAP
jgi:protein-tyrosine phosphatase